MDTFEMLADYFAKNDRQYLMKIRRQTSYVTPLHHYQRRLAGVFNLGPAYIFKIVFSLNF